jgi:hypothetical protein
LGSASSVIAVYAPAPSSSIAAAVAIAQVIPVPPPAAADPAASAATPGEAAPAVRLVWIADTSPCGADLPTSIGSADISVASETLTPDRSRSPRSLSMARATRLPAACSLSPRASPTSR